MTWLWIAAGGALGATARYGLAGWVHAFAPETFPWGTLVVNVVGSTALGVLLGWFEGTAASPELRQALAIGVLGAFTTFSTFAYEAVAMLRDGEWGAAGGYVAASVLLGLAGVLLGLTVAGRLLAGR